MLEDDSNRVVLAIIKGDIKSLQAGQIRLTDGQKELKAEIVTLNEAVRTQPDVNDQAIRLLQLGLQSVQINLNSVEARMSVLEKDAIKRDEFNPVNKLVYGAVAIILLAVIGAIVALVVL
jgi:hypothetical protein